MNPQLSIANKGEINVIRNLNAKEYKNYKEAASYQKKFFKDQQLWLIVHFNYDDYWLLINRYEEDCKKINTLNLFDMDKMKIEINRHILNYLSSIRPFLDHSESNIKKQYGKNSDRFKKFKKICTDIYDENFSYRFLYKLRNYTQHCNMPLGTLILNPEIDSQQTKYTLEIKFNRDELLKYNSWGTLQEEIEQLPNEFDINPHIAEMMKCIDEINKVKIQDNIPDLLESVDYIENLLSCISNFEGTPYITRNDNQIELIPLHISQMIREAFIQTYNKIILKNNEGK